MTFLNLKVVGIRLLFNYLLALLWRNKKFEILKLHPVQCRYMLVNLVRLLDIDHGNFMIDDFPGRKPDEIKVYSVIFTVIV